LVIFVLTCSSKRPFPPLPRAPESVGGRSHGAADGLLYDHYCCCRRFLPPINVRGSSFFGPSFGKRPRLMRHELPGLMTHRICLVSRRVFHPSDKARASRPFPCGQHTVAWESRRFDIPSCSNIGPSLGGPFRSEFTRVISASVSSG